MEIRQYAQDDLDGIEDMVAAVNQTTIWPQKHPCGWNRKRVETEFDLEEYKDPLFLVAVIERRIVGLVAGHDMDSFVREDVPHIVSKFPDPMSMKTAYYQRDVLCHPAFQRKGVATILMNGLESFAKREKYVSLITRTVPDNSIGINVFDRRGFSTLFEDDNPPRTYLSKNLLSY